MLVVTDALLTKSQAKRLAMIAHTGMARAIYPVHAPTDGDVVFAAATGKHPVDPLFGLTELGMIAANTVARAIARGVHGAIALPFLGALPAWTDRFGRSHSEGSSPGLVIQTLTESDDAAADEIAWACRWIICSMKL